MSDIQTTIDRDMRADQWVGYVASIRVGPTAWRSASFRNSQHGGHLGAYDAAFKWVSERYVEHGQAEAARYGAYLRRQLRAILKRSSYSDFAGLVGVSKSTVARWMNDDVDNYSGLEQALSYYHSHIEHKETTDA